MRLLRLMCRPKFWLTLRFKHDVEPTPRGRIDHYTFTVGWAWLLGAGYGLYKLVKG